MADQPPPGGVGEFVGGPPDPWDTMDIDDMPPPDLPGLTPDGPGDSGTQPVGRDTTAAPAAAAAGSFDLGGDHFLLTPGGVGEPPAGPLPGHHGVGEAGMVPPAPPAHAAAPAAQAVVAPELEAEQTYIWGTGIALEPFKATFQEFLETYRLPSADPTKLPFFRTKLAEIRTCDGQTLEVDFTVLSAECPDVYQNTISSPSECLQLMSTVAEEVYRRLYPDTLPEFSLQVAAKNLPQRVGLRDLGPQQIETLVAIQGMVVRASRLLPEIRMAHFRCWTCHHVEESLVDRGRIFEPVRCRNCHEQYSMQLVHNRCMFDDKQIVRVQEAPEFLAEGETPVTLSVVVYGPLCDVAVPGDRVAVTGIYRSAPMRLNANTRIVRTVFRTHVDAVHIEKSRRTKGVEESAPGQSKDQAAVPTMQGVADDENDDGANQLPDPDTLHAIERLAALPDIVDILVRSLAPTVYGHENVKRGVLCQLFGGCRKKFPHGKARAELHVLMCGDPGVAKSQLLTRLHRISPRGVYTSGKGSSSVGLTAFVTKDSDTGEFVLEPGALVLSDRGLCCIDELDKMDDSTRSILHEVLEQQTLSVAKAGIIAQLNARTSLLAAANPKESQWNPSLNIVENLQIEPTLLSRFDLIFLLLDRHDEAQDRKLAGHVLAMYTPASEHQKTEPQAQGGTGGDVPISVLEQEHPHEWLLPGRVLPAQTFSRYVAFARAHIKPTLTEDACRALSAGYVEMRRARGGGKTVTATLRQLESMIRLAEALAKMRCQAEVTRENAVDGKTLMATALQEAATDPRTGLINMDMFAAPDPSATSTEACMVKLERIIEQRYIAVGRRAAPVSELRHALNEQLPKPMAMHTFTELLSLMAGGDVLLQFSATTAQFGSKGGVAGEE